ncbi:hypothetical protein L596_019150 [Steinernema carpocapsae]|uniref:C-type lectin domain-containing protein n=1 Tax=Steinernema carpocapsae TaxID=34508 RepID=A0A4U5N900_STECR|nr:hypothetical protein L596_019150 [Steinernema carpocapsae]
MFFASLLLLVSLSTPLLAFCRLWSPEGRYCIEDRDRLNLTIVRLRRDTYGKTEFVWPDDEFMRLMQTSGELFSNIKEIQFENNCNWAFGWRHGGELAMPNLRFVTFDEDCAIWYDSLDYCVELPAAWSRPGVHFVNSYVCEPEAKADELHSSGDTNRVKERQQAKEAIEFQKDINRMLNNTLTRAIHLQRATEHQNRELNRTLVEMEQNLATCNSLLGHLSSQAEMLEERLNSCVHSRSADRVLIKHYKYVLTRLRHELAYIFSFGMDDVVPHVSEF